MRKFVLITSSVIVAVVALAASLKPPRPLVYQSEVIVDLPRSQAWARLKDLSLAHCYVPGITRTEITSAASEGVGPTRRVYSSDSSYIIETVTQWREGSGLDLALTGDDGSAPPPFARAAFSYQLQDAGGESTRASTRLSFTMRAGYLGEWAAKGLLAGEFQDRTDAVATALKRFYETGQCEG